MKRSTIRLPQQRWGSTVTKYANHLPQVAADDFTAGTKNIDTYLRGAITKREAPIDYGTPDGPIKDQYEAKFSDGTHHMLVMGNGKLQYSSGSGTFTTVTSGYSTIGNMEFASYADRVYFCNGISVPQVYDRTAVYGGAAPVTVPKTKDMGAQAPGSAPTTTLAVDSTANQVPAGAHTYKVTFTYYGFEESNGSPASTPAVTADGTHTAVDLTNIPIGGYGVTARNIYRDDTDGVWRLVGFINNNTATTYTDKASIGTSVIPSDNGIPRNFSLTVEHGDRIWMAGIAGAPTELDFSEAGLPDIVLSTNTILCNPSDPITGLVVYNDRVVVFNRNSFGQIFGTTADTFRYAEVPGSIGCVDNRSIQVRTINGVPTLLWLSAKGFYSFNGSTVDYISDDIEDQVRFNLQQANQVKGSNSQSSQSDFEAGTLSTGIDTTVIPGSLTTKGQPLNGDPTNNPIESFDTQTEWEGFSAADAVVTRLPSLQNKLASAVQTTITAPSSTLSGLEAVNTNDFRTILPAFSTGETLAVSSESPGNRINNENSGTVNSIAIRISPTRSGTITSVSLNARWFGITPNTTYFCASLYNDLGGTPGVTQLAKSAPITVFIPSTPSQGIFIPSIPCSLHVTGGTNYWLAVELNQTNGSAIDLTADAANVIRLGTVQLTSSGSAWSGNRLTYCRRFELTSTAPTATTHPWAPMETNLGTEDIGSVSGTYVFDGDAVPASGTFTSQVIDSGLCPQAQAITVQTVGTNPPSWGGAYAASGSFTVDQADSNDMLVGLVSSTTVVDPTQTQGFTLALTKRYWRVRGTLQTADDRHPAYLSYFYFRPPDDVTWTSQAVDCSADVTSYDAVVEVKTAGTGGGLATLTVATSDDDITYSAFGDIGSAAVKRYIKFKYRLVTGSAHTAASYVTSLQFSYKLTSTWVSQAIDLGAAPEGWDVFQTSDAANGGTITYEMKSAATSGALGAASYHAITVGTFPNSVPLNRWIQYRVTLSAEANKVPVIQSVTTNWFIKLVSSVRAASLFYFRTYYVCLAEYNNATNNLMLVYDPNGNWRVHRDLNAATFGFFFQDPYYGDAADGKIKKLLGGIDKTVELDVRTKAFDFGDLLHRKHLRKVMLVLENTGATFEVSYSTNGGEDYQLLRDAAGVTQWTLPDDGGLTVKRLVPSYADLSQLSGKTIMVRIHENTTKQVAIHEIHVEAVVREGEYIDG